MFAWFANLSIKTKIVFAASTTLLLVTVFIFTYYPVVQKKQAHYAMEVVNVGIANTVAYGVGMGLREGDFGMVSNSLDFAKNDPNIVYILVVDADSATIAEYNPQSFAFDVPFLLGLKEESNVVPLFGMMIHAGHQVLRCGGTPCGFILIGMNMQPFYAEISRNTHVTVITCLVILLVGVAIAVYLSRALTKPIDQLVAAADTAAQGRFDIDIPVKGSNELSVLATSFNVMLRNVRHSIAEIRDIQDFNESILKSTAEGIIGFDIGGRVIFGNPSAAAILGYRDDELTDLSIKDIFQGELPDRDSDKVNELITDEVVLDPKGRRSRETAFRRKDGTDFPAEYVASPFRRGEQNVGTILCFSDITERKQQEKKRLEFEQQLQQTQKLESLGVLTGGIAHDFNNILMAMLGNAELALNEMSPMSGARGRVTHIMTAAHRAAELCRQMMAYSGKASFAKESVDIRELIAEMAHLLKTSISKKATLNLDIAGGLPPVVGDPSQIRQIVMNLIINASDALGDQNGVITVSAHLEHCGVEYLSNVKINNDLKPGNYVCISVADTGCGMDAETQARIFEPFFTTKFTGRGLGLSAALGIVKTHKGALELTSKPGEGTTFKILFPASETSTSISASATPPSAAELQNSDHVVETGVVLLVDDEEMLREIGVEMLELMGHTALSAVDGREAVELYRRRSSEIDVVILDMTMPNMGGAEAFNELARINPAVRVIIASGHTTSDVSTCFKGKSPVGFLQKPFTLSRLEKMMSVAMPRKRDQSQAIEDPAMTFSGTTIHA